MTIIIHLYSKLAHMIRQQIDICSFTYLSQFKLPKLAINLFKMPVKKNCMIKYTKFCSFFLQLNQ